MTTEEVVRERLLDLPAVTSLVGERIYMLRLPQNAALPSIRLQVISEPTDIHLRGGSGVYRSRIRVDAYAREASGLDPYASATAIADAVHGDETGSALHCWHGVAGGSPPTRRVRVATRIDREVSYEAGEERFVRCRQDYWVTWSRM